jgi:hypothetical protein
MNKKAMLPILVVIVLVVIILGALIFVPWKTGNNILGENVNNDRLLTKVSSLEPLNLTTIEKYEDYKELTDNLNDFILIINDQTKTNIPLLKNTQEDWTEASKLISKYSPLINNYNSMILTAKTCEIQKTNESYQKFYGEAGKFSLELTFISATLFHEVTFGLVGGVFNSLGVGSLALKCPACASSLMSGAYWTIKTTLVESASGSADYIFEKLGYKQEVKK